MVGIMGEKIWTANFKGIKALSVSLEFQGLVKQTYISMALS
jgi:hypothetical protein